MSKATIVLQIHKDLVAGKLKLPALPKVAMQVKDMAAKPDTDIRSLAQFVQADPSFCGHIIEVANSPLYRGVTSIQSVSDALNRIGLSEIKNIALSYAIKATFNIRNRALKPYLTQIWQQSTYTAALAHMMAKRSQIVIPDRAILAGLLQNIGTLPLLNKATQFKELVQDANGIEVLLNKYAANLGAAMIRTWELDEDFQEVAKHRNDWFRTHSGPADLTDLLLMARLHSFIGTAQMRKLPRINEIPAFSRLDLGELTPKDTFEFIDEAKQEIMIIQKAFGG